MGLNKDLNTYYNTSVDFYMCNNILLSNSALTTINHSVYSYFKT